MPNSETLLESDVRNYRYKENIVETGIKKSKKAR